MLGGLLCASCVFGLISRLYALKCTIQSASIQAVGRTFNEHLQAYSREKKEIQEGAKYWGITLQTGVRMERIMSEFFKPLPKWVVWLASRHLKRNQDNPQVAHILLVKGLTGQGIYASLQITVFFAFFVFGIVYASAI